MTNSRMTDEELEDVVAAPLFADRADAVRAVRELLGILMDPARVHMPPSDRVSRATSVSKAFEYLEGIDGPDAGPTVEAISAAVQCRGANCKTPVIWAHNPNTGKPMPLDARAPVYRVELVDRKLTAVRDRTAFVGHHATCRDVATFSGRNRSPKT